MDWAQRNHSQRRAHWRRSIRRSRFAGYARCASRGAHHRQSGANYRSGNMNSDRTLPWDWFPGRVPENVALAPDAYLETTYSFQLFRSRQAEAVRIGAGASIYLGVMFDLGPDARVSIGEFTLMNGARIICDSQISIGDYCL